MAQEPEICEIPQFKLDYGDTRGKCSKCKTSFMSNELKPFDEKEPSLRYCERCLKIVRLEHEAIEAQNTGVTDYKNDYLDELERKQAEKLNAERDRKNEERKRKARIEAQKRYAESRKKPELIEKRNEYMRNRYKMRVEKTAELQITSYVNEIRVKCPSCKSERIRKNGYLIKIDEKVQKYQCRDCHYTFTHEWSEE